MLDDLKTVAEKREYCLREIFRRMPPKNRHDEFLLKMYQSLLDDMESARHENEFDEFGRRE